MRRRPRTMADDRHLVLKGKDRRDRVIGLGDIGEPAKITAHIPLLTLGDKAVYPACRHAFAHGLPSPLKFMLRYGIFPCI